MGTGEAPPYQAPIGNGNFDPNDVARGCYMIKLAPGHSIRDVSDAIGTDIEPYIAYVFSFSAPPDSGVRFRVTGMDDSLFAAIRGYRGVRMVEYDIKLELDPSF